MGAYDRSLKGGLAYTMYDNGKKTNRKEHMMAFYYYGSFFIDRLTSLDVKSSDIVNFYKELRDNSTIENPSQFQ